ncbi:MAG: hypothetical protein IT352_16105 [Gemmatimonadales bacterium]|nr:hypothetical protein [Gemmatimonadales bacterium]
MLSFATEFPVDGARTVGDFLRAVVTWILGSPHTTLRRTDLEPLINQSEAAVQKGVEHLEVLSVSSSGTNSAGVRYIRRDEGLEWTTTIVFANSGSGAWVGIRVACESSHPATRLPPAKKPVIVRSLIGALGGAYDGPLPITERSHRLADAEVDVATGLLTGKAGCRLPLVYVSVGFRGDYLLDPDHLASDLAGMAHVVVEPNRPFSVRLKIAVAAQNVYGGTVGVYWPDGAGRRSFFLGREFNSPEEIHRAVVEEVTTALTNRRPLDACTWPHIQETASRVALESLRASGSQEIDKYISTFDRELAAKNERLQVAELEIGRLRAELDIYEARLPAGAAPLLRHPIEQEFYPGEIASLALAALEDALERQPADSRRRHVLLSILASNPRGPDRAGEHRERLKDLLRGSRTVDAKIRRGLEDMGFAISEAGKHYKLVFQGDDRYTYTLPKSGSDNRGGLNAASQIGRLLF